MVEVLYPVRDRRRNTVTVSPDVLALAVVTNWGTMMLTCVLLLLLFIRSEAIIGTSNSI